MFFRKKKPPEPKVFCLHEWELADYKVVDSYNGIDVDILHKIELGCQKCQSLRTVDSFEYNKMVDLGLVKSIEFNKGHFNYSDDLEKIFKNTIKMFK